MTKRKQQKRNKRKNAKQTTAIVVRTPRPRSRGGKGTAAIHQHAIHAACSITDPFCIHARASKWPDNTLSVTLPWQTRGTFTISSDAAGTGVAVIVPCLPYGWAVSSNNGSNLSTYAALNAFDGTSTVTPFTAQYRLVSGGVKVSCITSQMDSSGYIFCQEYSASDNLSIGNTLNYTSTQVNSYYRQSCKSNKPISYVFRPAGPKSREFVVSNTQATGSLVTNDWTFLQISVQGAPASSPILVVDYVFNFEIIPYQTSAMVSLASRNTNPIPQEIKDISHKTLIDLPSFLTGDEDTVSGKIQKQIKDMVVSQLVGHKNQIKGAVTGLATAYGGPIVGSLVGGMTSSW